MIPVFVHPYPVPAPHAALLRILHLAVAMAEAGGAVEVWTGPMEVSADACFRWAGVAVHPGVRLAPVFATAGAGGPGRRAEDELAAALAELAACRPAPAALILRGDAGAGLLARRLASRRGGASGRGRSEAEILIHELHRPPGSTSRRGPRVLAARGLSRLGGRRPSRATLRRAVEAADGLVVGSDALRDDLAETHRLPPALVLPSGAPPAVAPSSTDEGRDLDILYIGKLERRKGVHGLLAALAGLPGRRLLAAGGSPREVAACRRLAHRLGVADRVEFPGFQPPRRMPALLARAKVGVCPLPVGLDPVSDRYTSPLKLLEMMAAGLPVVATAVPPVTRWVRHGEDAWLVPPGDPAALAAGLERLLRDRPLAHLLAASASRRSTAHSWPRRAADLSAFLESCPILS